MVVDEGTFYVLRFASKLGHLWRRAHVETLPATLAVSALDKAHAQEESEQKYGKSMLVSFNELLASV